MKVDNEGKKLWQQIIETITVYSHVKSKISKFDEKKIKQKQQSFYYPTTSISNPPKSNNVNNSTYKNNQLDKATKRKLTKGIIRPEAYIDLHDMTQDKAYKALSVFIKQSIALQRRTVLVITGKGKNLQGVLRNKLPQWLENEEISKNIISVMAATKQDGGEGAFYIRLKNQNKKFF